jgi:type IV secretory pathway VirB4 component
VQHQLFRDRLKDSLKTMRRKNAVVIVATQQISDIAHTDIVAVVVENCPTKNSPAQRGIEESQLT